jgi:hypothetical protein
MPTCRPASAPVRCALARQRLAPARPQASAREPAPAPTCTLPASGSPAPEPAPHLLLRAARPSARLQHFPRALCLPARCHRPNAQRARCLGLLASRASRASHEPPLLPRPATRAARSRALAPSRTAGRAAPRVGPPSHSGAAVHRWPVRENPQGAPVPNRWRRRERERGKKWIRRRLCCRWEEKEGHQEWES